MQPKPVKTKRDFVVRYSAGEFGNASPTWDGLTDWGKSEWPQYAWTDNSQLFHIRNRIAGGPTYYDLPIEMVATNWHHLVCDKNVPADSLYISAMAPTSKTLFQGEVMQTPTGLALYYTTVAKPMREALKVSNASVSGIIAVSLLRNYLCPNSYDWMQILLDRYPGHVIEFSTYSTCWGTLPNFNTVYWEIRLY